MLQTPHHLRTEYDVMLMETEAFEWLPGLGAFVEGYSLIVSKQHVSNTGCLDDTSIVKLEQFATEVKRILRVIYAVGTIVFEHGSLGVRRKAGSCIEHHHLHILPFNLPKIPSHMHRVMPVSKPIKSFDALREYQTMANPSSIMRLRKETALSLMHQWIYPVNSCAKFWLWNVVVLRIGNGQKTRTLNVYQLLLTRCFVT